MKVLVAGGAGYIGSVTTQLLCDAGHDVVVFDNLERGYRPAVDPRATFIQGDLRNKEDILTALQTEQPEAVIHFAAYIEVGESMKEPLPFFENNVSGSLNLMHAMVEADCKKLIFSSTCATYGTPEKIPMDESLPQHPESVYGESKLLCEKIFQWAEQIHGVECVFLRYFNACGATEAYGEAHIPESHLIPLILQVAQGKREKIYIFGDDYETRDGTCVRDYIHIKDLAQAHILALEPGIRGAFNLGNGDGYSVKEVIDVCRRVTGHPIPAEIQPRRAGDCTTLVADATKARTQLGWNPQYASLETIVQSAWTWHQAHPEGYSTS
ncbi:MAG: UDP-glucose 4-epimerase GalE [Kiritimatiellaceae bacterium TMED266]|nr:MAG: UDP-glucose 4-epimerase GalE [Kiritimatiellaceae bacterium TMED266]